MSLRSRLGLSKKGCPRCAASRHSCLGRDKAHPSFSQLYTCLSPHPLSKSRPLPQGLFQTTSSHQLTLHLFYEAVWTAQVHKHAAWTFLPSFQSRPLWEVNVCTLHCTQTPHTGAMSKLHPTWQHQSPKSTGKYDHLLM